MAPKDLANLALDQTAQIWQIEIEYLLLILGKYYSWSQGSHEQDAPKNMIKNKIYYCQLEVKVCETGNVDIQMRQIARVAGIHGDVRAIDTFPPFPRGKRFKTNQTNYIKFKIYFMAVL